MPPKPKFEREQIIDTALQIVAVEGFDALTARSLGEKLGSSARPIFTVFSGMDEVRKEVMAAARCIYDSYVAIGLKEELPFKGVGKAYIRFAAEHPKLFRLLFMREQESVYGVTEVLAAIDANKERILQSVAEGYGLAQDVAMKIYIHLWVYTHGIAVLLATKMCTFSEQEISDMLTEVFVGILKTNVGESKK